MVKARLPLWLFAMVGCVDGDALRLGLRGERAPDRGRAPDAAVDRGAAPDARPDAHLDPVDAAPPPLDAAPPPLDAAPPDMAPDPRCVPETCNDADDDCDGVVDEGVADCCVPGTRRACGRAIGACTEGEQFCTIDLEWSGCTGAPPGVEACDGQVDEDCDGVVDEGVANACGGCGEVPVEACNGVDDDCDGVADEGVQNACGACGPVPRETCNGRDDDCDGQADEGTLNACGACGAVPAEACNGRDDDCDGRTDEGTLNACGACGPIPPEACTGVDDDCDGRIDERACYAFVLDERDNVWRAPPGLNSSPLITRGRISAIFATVRGGERIWAIVDNDLHGYDLGADRWLDAPPIQDRLGAEPIQTAYALPSWWGAEGAPGRFASITVSSGVDYRIFDFDPLAGEVRFVTGGSLAENWQDDPNAPQGFPLTTALVDLFDNRDYWPGDARETCDGGPPGPIGAVSSRGRVYTFDAASCFLFMDDRPVEQWRGFQRPGAPDPRFIVAWDFVNRIDRTGAHVIVLSQPADGR